MITITSKGNWKKTEDSLRRMQKADIAAVLNRFGVLGVNALSTATPVESGETAASWYYSIVQRRGYSSIRWHNSNVVDGIPIAVILQYGHGTGTGGWVEGRDYIMPAIIPIFEQIAAEAWKEVTR